MNESRVSNDHRTDGPWRCGRWSLAAALVSGLVAGCGAPPDGRGDLESRSSSLTSKQSLIQRWAPVHYQDVDKGGDKSLNGVSDYVIRFDYEAASNAQDHWNAWDKWDNLQE